MAEAPITLPNGIVLPVLHADARILAVNKPEGLAAIPEGAGEKGSLRSQLETALGTKLFVIHRLDKEVSGVIVFARDAVTHSFLNRQFHDRQVRKRYQALATGIVLRGQGKIMAALREFGSGRMGVDAENGKPSETRYRVRERFAAHTLLDVSPVTGRRHQIRVHLYSIGHPIAGDTRYGDRAAQRAYPRLMLHAAAITLPMPEGDPVHVEAPPSDQFLAVLAALRAAEAKPGEDQIGLHRGGTETRS